MPLPVTHALVPIVVASLFKDFSRKYRKHITFYTILVAGAAGLLPDIDIFLTWALQSVGIELPALAHRGLTHTPAFGLLFIVPGIVLFVKDRKKMGMLFFAVSFGVLIHILLDFLAAPPNGMGVMLLWPLSDSSFGLRLGVGDTLPALERLNVVILLSWLWYEGRKRRKSDFI